MALNPLQVLESCLGSCFGSCLPSQPKPTNSTNSRYRAGHYNNQLRKNLGMPDRPPAGAYESYPKYNPPPTLELPPVPSERIRPSTAPGSMRRPSATVSRTESTQVRWSTKYMTRDELKDLFNLVHETFSHLPYAICGLAAMIDHGFLGRQANRISLICPRESKDNVKAWAATGGYPTSIDSVGLPARDGSFRRVRIKFIDHGFEDLELVPSKLGNAVVLSPVSTLDNVAAGYLQNRKRGDERTLQVIANDIFWCLDHLASTRRGKVDPSLLPTFLGEECFADFTTAYMTARSEMARAGIDVAAVLARHRAAASLREHDAMLRGYGMKGDIVTSQPGQFERMQDLVRSKSIYTIRDPESRPTSLVTASGDVGRSLTAPKKAVMRPERTRRPGEWV
ncbi:hypothetical protein GGR50DRAFT_457055 [Xylaria sp. CBS 124048]|nr:hypothetical protein GGR50DRAFT_457055 [Xylaria sp. CBS 124048]